MLFEALFFYPLDYSFFNLESAVASTGITFQGAQPQPIAQQKAKINNHRRTPIPQHIQRPAGKECNPASATLEDIVPVLNTLRPVNAEGQGSLNRLVPNDLRIPFALRIPMRNTN